MSGHAFRAQPIPQARCLRAHVEAACSQHAIGEQEAGKGQREGGLHGGGTEVCGSGGGGSGGGGASESGALWLLSSPGLSDLEGRGGAHLSVGVQARWQAGSAEGTSPLPWSSLPPKPAGPQWTAEAGRSFAAAACVPCCRCRCARHHCSLRRLADCVFTSMMNRTNSRQIVSWQQRRRGKQYNRAILGKHHKSMGVSFDALPAPIEPASDLLLCCRPLLLGQLCQHLLLSGWGGASKRSARKRSNAAAELGGLRRGAPPLLVLSEPHRSPGPLTVPRTSLSVFLDRSEARST